MLTHVMNGDLRNYKLYSWLPSLSKVYGCQDLFIKGTNDKYTVSVVKNDVTIGHLPRAISRICSLFLVSLTSKRAFIIKEMVE